MDMNTFAQLADSSATSMAEKFGAFKMEGIGEYVAANMAEKKTQLMKAAAEDIGEMVDQANEFFHARAAQIVEYQGLIAAQEGLTSQLTKALQYGFESQNFWPALSQLGYPTYDCKDKSLLKMPKDWAPKVGSATTLAGMTTIEGEASVVSVVSVVEG